MTGRLICRGCGRDYPLTAPRWACDCGGLLEVDWRLRLRPGIFSDSPLSLWRYRIALPLDAAVVPVTLGEGMTPMVEMRSPGARRVWVKMDHLQPTGSFKDRGAAVMISRLRALGVQSVVEDSSGNAGAAVAAYCARGGLECTVYVPASAPQAKIAQIKAYGAHVVSVAGSREAAARAVRKAAEKTYYAGHSVDPFFVQGTKTVAYEIAEQLGWRAPRRVVVPLGNGTLFLGLTLGFTELFVNRLVAGMPRIVAFQSQACNPLCRAFRRNAADVAGIRCRESIADGIAVARPVQAQRILAAAAGVDAAIMDVSESAIHGAWEKWAALGLSVEPTAAVALAGLDQLENVDDTVVVVTGHGLKRSRV